MDEPICVYKNMIWEILDEGSKLTIIDMLIDNGFVGNCKLIAKIVGDVTVMEINDEYNHQLVLPIDIIDILNK